MIAIILISFCLIMILDVINVRDDLAYTMHIMFYYYTMIMPHEPSRRMLDFLFNVVHVAYFIIDYLVFNVKDNYSGLILLLIIFYLI